MLLGSGGLNVGPVATATLNSRTGSGSDRPYTQLVVSILVDASRFWWLNVGPVATATLNSRTGSGSDRPYTQLVVSILVDASRFWWLNVGPVATAPGSDG